MQHASRPARAESPSPNTTSEARSPPAKRVVRSAPAPDESVRGAALAPASRSAAAALIRGAASAALEVVLRRPEHVEDGAVAGDGHAQLVVERRHAVVDLAPADLHAAARQRVAARRAERVEVGGGEAERGHVRAHVALRDRDRVAGLRARQRAVEPREHARGAGERVDLEHALVAERAPQAGASAAHRRGRAPCGRRAGGLDGRPLTRAGVVRLVLAGRLRGGRRRQDQQARRSDDSGRERAHNSPI